MSGMAVEEAPDSIGGGPPAVPPTTPKTPASLHRPGQVWLLDIQNPVSFVGDCPPEKRPQIWVKVLHAFTELFRPEEEGGGLGSAHVELQAVSACRVLRQAGACAEKLDPDVATAASVAHANLLVLFDYPELQEAIADCLFTLIDTEVVPYAQILGKLLVWASYVCTLPKISDTALRCLTGTCQFFCELDWANADEFKGYCAELCISEAFLCRPGSTKVLAAVFSQEGEVTRAMHRHIMPTVITSVKREGKLSDRQAVLVDSLVAVWDTLEDLHLAVYEHEVVKPYAVLAVKSDIRLFSAFKAVLGAFAHSRKATKKTREALRRILREESNLLASLDAPNAIVRRNSIALLGSHYPVCVAGTGKADLEKVKEEQFNIIVTALTDPVPEVRVHAVTALCEVVARHFNDIPQDLVLPAVGRLFSNTHGLLYDKTDANVRHSVLRNTRDVLLKAPLMHEYLKTMLKGLKHLNDPSSRVRQVFTSLLVSLLKEPYITLADIGITDQQVVARLGVEKSKSVVENLITIVRRSPGVWFADGDAGKCPETNRQVVKALLSVSARYPSAGVALYSGLVATSKTNPEAVVSLVGLTLNWLVTTTCQQQSILVENVLHVVSAMVTRVIPRLQSKKRCRGRFLRNVLTPATFAAVERAYDTVVVKQVVNHLRAMAASLDVEAAPLTPAVQRSKRRRTDTGGEAEAEASSDDEHLAEGLVSLSTLKGRFLQKLRDDRREQAERAAAAGGDAAVSQLGVAPSPVPEGDGRPRQTGGSQRGSQRGTQRGVAASQRSQRAAMRAKVPKAGAPAADPGTEWRLLMHRIAAEGGSSVLVELCVDWLDGDDDVGALLVAAELLRIPVCEGRLLDDDAWTTLTNVLLRHVEDVTRLLRTPRVDEMSDQDCFTAAAKLELLTRLVINRACLGGIMGRGADATDADAGATQGSATPAASATPVPKTPGHPSQATQNTVPASSQRSGRKRKQAEPHPNYRAEEFERVVKVLTRSLLPACKAGSRVQGSLLKVLLGEQVIVFLTDCVSCYLLGRQRPAVDGAALSQACLDVSPKLFPRLLQLFGTCFEMQCTPHLFGQPGNDEWLDYFFETFLQKAVAGCDACSTLPAWDAWGSDSAEDSREKGWRALAQAGAFRPHLAAFFSTVIRSAGVGRAPLKEMFTRRVMQDVLLAGGSTHMVLIAADMASRFKQILAALLEAFNMQLSYARNGVDLTEGQATAMYSILSVMLSHKSRPVTQQLVAYKSDSLAKFFSDHQRLLNSVKGAGMVGMSTDPSAPPGTPGQRPERELFSDSPGGIDDKPRALELWEKLQALDWAVPLPKIIGVKKDDAGGEGAADAAATQAEGQTATATAPGTQGATDEPMEAPHDPAVRPLSMDEDVM